MTTVPTETLIVSNLINNEQYVRAVLPFISPTYFESQEHKILFKVLSRHISKYNARPDVLILKKSIERIPNLSEEVFKNTNDLIDVTATVPEQNMEWLIDTTEQFCKDRALYLALRESIAIVDEDNPKKPKTSITEILQQALAVSFDNQVGHDYFEDLESRFDEYQKKVEVVPFDLQIFNDIMGGGAAKKTVTVFMAGTNVGKSMIMCSCAAGQVLLGKKVLYITLEMADKKIAKRLDANILNTNLDDIQYMQKSKYVSILNNIQKKSTGQLVVKEYPTTTAGVNHFRFLVQELKLKKGFTPDIIYIDYINLCTSSRYGHNSGGDSYGLVKSIAEEMRGLAVELNLPIVTATQTNRMGFGSSDIDLENIAESFGLAATADVIIGMMTSDELRQMNRVQFKQLKNRDNDITLNTRFQVGVDRAKMKFYDIEQDDYLAGSGNDTSVFDNSSFGQREEDMKNKFKKNSAWESFT